MIDANDCPTNFTSPFNVVVSGPSQVGKTTYVHMLIRNEGLITPSPTRIVYMYGEMQPMIRNLQDNPPKNTRVEIVQGWQPTVVNDMNAEDNNLLVLDDVMTDCRDEVSLSNLFTRGGHHRNISVVFLAQNYFFAGKSAVDIRRNTHYLIMFACKQDKKQVALFGQRILPGYNRAFLDAYDDATSQKHGHLLVDMTTSCPTRFMLRSNTLDTFPRVSYKRHTILKC